MSLLVREPWEDDGKRLVMRPETNEEFGRIQIVEDERIPLNIIELRQDGVVKARLWIERESD